jgi:hypothetical protein
VQRSEEGVELCAVEHAWELHEMGVLWEMLVGERCAWEPNKVTSCVHVECYRLGVGTEGEGESVVGAW